MKHADGRAQQAAYLLQEIVALDAAVDVLALHGCVLCLQVVQVSAHEMRTVFQLDEPVRDRVLLQRR